MHEPFQAPWGDLTHCPAKTMKPEVLQLGEMLADAEQGILPTAGGMQDQPIRFIHAWRMLYSTGWLKFAQQKEANNNGK